MNPQAVTVGARLGRRLNAKLIAPAVNEVNEADRVAFLGGLLASIAGGTAAIIGRDTAAELLRIAIDRLQADPQLELPPGVRVAMDAVHAAAGERDGGPDA